MTNEAWEPKEGQEVMYVQPGDIGRPAVFLRSFPKGRPYAKIAFLGYELVVPREEVLPPRPRDRFWLHEYVLNGASVAMLDDEEWTPKIGEGVVVRTEDELDYRSALVAPVWMLADGTRAVQLLDSAGLWAFERIRPFHPLRDDGLLTIKNRAAWGRA